MLIALEGIDGSGKSTVAKLLASRLSDDYRILMLSEPSNLTEYGESVRELIRKKDRVTNALQRRIASLLLMDRIELTEKHINPFIEQHGKRALVIQDRTWLSTAAYQSKTPKEVERYIRFYSSHPSVYKPDICFILELPVSEALRRLASRDSSAVSDVFETKQHLTMVKCNYREIEGKSPDILPFPIYPVDAYSSLPPSITEFITSTIDRYVPH